MSVSGGSRFSPTGAIGEATMHSTMHSTVSSINIITAAPTQRIPKQDKIEIKIFSHIDEIDIIFNKNDNGEFQIRSKTNKKSDKPFHDYKLKFNDLDLFKSFKNALETAKRNEEETKEEKQMEEKKGEVEESFYCNYANNSSDNGYVEMTDCGTPFPITINDIKNHKSYFFCAFNSEQCHFWSSKLQPQAFPRFLEPLIDKISMLEASEVELSQLYVSFVCLLDI